MIHLAWAGVCPACRASLAGTICFNGELPHTHRELCYHCEALQVITVAPGMPYGSAMVGLDTPRGGPVKRKQRGR